MTADNPVKAAMAAARRAATWITSQQREDGGFFEKEAGIRGYGKVPYALATLGYLPQAARLLNWVAAHHFTAEGNFRAPQHSDRPRRHERWPIYAHAWLVQGAHKAGWFDLSFRGAQFILRHQVSSGGFWAVQDGRRYLECVCTSWGGLAALTVGHVDAARRAGRCLTRLVDQQPDPGRFYFRMTLATDLVTDVPPGGELHYFVDAAKPGQIYFHPGIALIFLCRLYLATGDEGFLAAGQKTFDFTQRCADDVYRLPPSGKLGLGSALLARITGGPEAQAAARQVAEYLTDSQQPGGFWLLPDLEIYRHIENKDDPEITLDLTAEFATFLCEIASSLQR